jgi:hypothetical protein
VVVAELDADCSATLDYSARKSFPANPDLSEQFR